MSQQADTAACMLLVLSTGCVCLLVASLLSGAGDPARGHGLDEVLSGVAFAAATYSLWRALGCGPVRLVVPVVAGFPVVSLLLAMSDGEQVAAAKWVLVLIVITGVAMVTRGESKAESLSIAPPIFWSLLSAISFAVTFWLGQQAMAEGETWQVLLVTRAVAVLVVLLFMPLTGGFRWPLRRDVPILVNMGLLDTAALALVLFAGRLPGGLYATVTASLFGVLTILLARVFLNERLIPLQWLGVVVTFSAIAVLGAT